MSRSCGSLDLTKGYGTSDHACCSYADDAERATIAIAWLRDGLRAGQRAVYVAPGTPDELASELSADPQLAHGLTAGTVVVIPVTELYDLCAPIDAPTQLAAYDDAVKLAIADGFAGIRVAADITALIADDQRRAAHLAWEQLADRHMTTTLLAPMCMYDARRISGADAIVCAHPLRDADRHTFGVFGLGPTTTCIEGEVDAFGSDHFTATLRGIPEQDTTVDLSRLTFIDACAAWQLQSELNRRRAGGRPLAVTGASPKLERLWRLCGFDASLLGAA